MGYHEYPTIAARYGVPIVVTGFEPVDLLRGVLAAVRQLEAGQALAGNAYDRVVSFGGNRSAQEVIARVFQPVDRKWRGIGLIPGSGWGLRPEFAGFDAEQRFAIGEITAQESPLCIAGQILQGLKKPPQCPAYAAPCTPEAPLGAPMVSGEGACAAYYRYHREMVPNG